MASEFATNAAAGAEADAEKNPATKAEAAVGGVSQAVEEARPQFISIPPETILNGQKAPFDMYVIVGSKQVRVFKQGEPLERERFERYLEKGDEALMARVDSIDSFFETGIVEMLSQAANETLGPSIRARGAVRALEFAGLDLFLFGFDKENFFSKVDRVHQILQVTLGLIHEDRARPYLVVSRQTEKMPNSVMQMVGATVIGGALLHKLQSVPIPTFQSFLLATYFRDISLLRNGLADRPAYDIHPEASMRLLEGYPGVTEQFRLIVQQHHESPGGSGFPKGLRGLDIFLLAKIPLAGEKLMELMKIKDLSGADETDILEDIALERFNRDSGISPVHAMRELLREAREAQRMRTVRTRA